MLLDESNITWEVSTSSDKTWCVAAAIDIEQLKHAYDKVLSDPNINTNSEADKISQSINVVRATLQFRLLYSLQHDPLQFNSTETRFCSDWTQHDILCSIRIIIQSLIDFSYHKATDTKQVLTATAYGRTFLTQ